MGKGYPRHPDVATGKTPDEVRKEMAGVMTSGKCKGSADSVTGGTIEMGKGEQTSVV